MAFSSYGGQEVWSSNEAPGSSDNLWAAGKLALAAGVAGGGLFAASKWNRDGVTGIDHMASFARTAGNLSPFQFFNTLRAPEFMFPFMSAGAQGLESGEYVFGKEFLTRSEDRRYLQRVTGRSSKELRGMGIGVPGSDAAEVVYKAHKNRVGGSLFARRGGKDSLLSADMMLMPRSSEVDPFLREQSRLNKATKGVLAGLGVLQEEGFSERNLFRKGTDEFSSVLPVPSVLGKVNGLGDVLRRTSYVRGIAAFEAGRFNDLLGGHVEQIFGKTGTRVFQNTLGFKPEVAAGPASAMMGRYAGRMALLGAGGIALSQTDWMRRNFGPMGEQFGIGATTAVGAYAAHKAGVSSKWVKLGVAASIFGQNILPGFDQGLVQGMASTAAGLDVVRGSGANPFNYYRRTLEGFVPGLTGWESGALLALGAAAASGGRVPFTGKRISEHLVESIGAKELGLPDLPYGSAPQELMSTRDIFWRDLERNHLGSVQGSENWRTSSGRRDILASLHRTNSVYETSELMKKGWANAEDLHRNMMKDSMTSADGINKTLLDKLERVAGRYDNSNAIQRNLFMNAEAAGVKAYYSFFGANARAAGMGEAIEKLGFRGPNLGRYASIGGAAFGLHQMLFGGALGSMEDSDELRDIYSGKKLVEVKGSRAWEGGGTPFEGGETKYFRPHALALLMNRTRESGVWGEDEDRISPIGKFIRKNFTYQLEREQYYDRPYPVSHAAFEDVPIIGGLLGSTIGRLIKPSKLMHVDAWARRQGVEDWEYRSVFKGSRQEPAYALGAPTPGVPTTKLSLAEQAKFASYQFRELAGLTGYAKGVVQSLITGDDSFGTAAPVLASSSEMDSMRNQFWEMQLGGMAFSNELWRRVLPRHRSDVQRSNPIGNTMPNWLPDKFRMGDPYRSVEWGEARLPGSGYASLHPELKGVSPEDYPMIARFAILGDIAPNSYEFRQVQKQVYKKRMEGGYSEAQGRFIDDIDGRVAAMVNQYSFDEMDDGAIALPGSGYTRSMTRGVKNFVRDAAAPAEYLVPMGFRPIQKLMGDDRSAVEQYEYERMYGTPMAFWDKPFRDWLRPAAYSAAHFMGYEGKPMWRVEADAVDQRFDELSFNKWMRLALQAEAAGDGRAKNKYLWAAGQTRMGVNPQGSTLGIYWSLPESDRSFMNAFANAQGDERSRILEMVPADQKHLYKAIWSRMDSGDPTAQMPHQSGVDENYLKQRYYDQPYKQLPPEDFVGWHEDVDMADIKVRYADRYAADLSDYGMWEKQLKKSMAQPMLDGSVDQVVSAGTIGAMGVRNEIANMLGYGGARPSLTVFSHGGPNRAQFTYNDSRDSELQQLILGALHGY